MSHSRCVLIPDGESGLALKVLRCLRRVADYKVFVLSSNKWSSIRFSRLHAGFVAHDAGEFDRKRLDVIKRVARQVGADLILPTFLPTIRLLSQHRDELSRVARLPPLAPLPLIDALSDKLSFGEILKREGIPHPATHHIYENAPDLSELSKLRYPLLVKPRDGCAGIGICKCCNLEELLAWFKREPNPRSYLLQELIVGSDVGCSVLCVEGEVLAHTVQKGILKSSVPYRPPAGVKFIEDNALVANVKKLVKAVRFSGVANFDLIYDGDTKEALLLEANTRYWTSLLASLAAGVNFPHLQCLASEGRSFAIPSYSNICHFKAEAVFSDLRKRWARKHAPRFKLCETALPFILRDPLPEISMKLARISKRVFLRTAKESRVTFEPWSHAP